MSEGDPNVSAGPSVPAPAAHARVELTLAPRQPFRLDLTALALVRRPNNLIDRWEAGVYRRVVPVADASGAGPAPQILLEVGAAPAAGSAAAGAGGMTERLRVRATGALPEEELARAAERAATHLLGLDVDLTDFYALAAADDRLRDLVAGLVGLRPPRYPGLFQALLNAVPCQQVTLVLGLRLLERLARRYGPALAFASALAPAGPLPLPDAQALAGADTDELGSLGFSGAKARTLTELAREVVSGSLDLAALADQPSAAVAARLQELFGVGRWTSDYVLLRGLGRLEVFPYGDSGARNGLARFLGEAGKPSYEWVAQAVAPWRPYSGLVYLHLLVAGMLRSGEFSAG